MTMTMVIPDSPGTTSAKPTGQNARRVPSTRNTETSPNRATTAGTTRDPARPPIHGTAKTIPYSQVENPR